MPDIAEKIQSILDKNNGYMVLSKLAQQLSKEDKNQLGIKSKISGNILRKKLELFCEERFIFVSKGKTVYIMIPQEPEEIIFGELSTVKSMSPKVLVNKLKLFSKGEIQAIINNLVEAGRAKILLNEKFEPMIFALTAKITREISREYTQEEFKNAFDELDKGTIFVRICNIRRKLNWPREVFDSMLRELRDKEIIQLRLGDEHLMTPDEVKDCFIDENNYLMGTVTWNE